MGYGTLIAFVHSLYFACLNCVSAAIGKFIVNIAKAHGSATFKFVVVYTEMKVTCPLVSNVASLQS